MGRAERSPEVRGNRDPQRPQRAGEGAEGQNPVDAARADFFRKLGEAPHDSDALKAAFRELQYRMVEVSRDPVETLVQLSQFAENARSVTHRRDPNGSVHEFFEGAATAYMGGIAAGDIMAERKAGIGPGPKVVVHNQEGRVIGHQG